MSLEATRELAALLGVDVLSLLHANRDRPWMVDRGSLAFASVRPGDVVRSPRGGAVEITCMGAPAALLGADVATLLANPAVAAAWQSIAAQMQSEGLSQLDIDTAKQNFGDTYAGLTGPGGIFSDSGDAETALQAAQSLIVAGKTVSGAVDHVKGLIAAAQGDNPTQVFQMFTGTMIGLATGAGVLTAGVGAAIVFGVGAALSFMQNIGLFGAAPSGVGLPGCVGTTWNPPPTIAVGCVAMQGATDAYGGAIQSGSPYWRTFPKKSGGNTNDDKWYVAPGGELAGRPGGSVQFTWSGSKNGPAYTWSGYASPRLIDTAFSDWHYLACGSVPPGIPQDFHDAFTQAWIANKEYELNGLKSQPNSVVFDHLVGVWNRAHSDSTYVDLAPAAQGNVGLPMFSSGALYWPCPGNLPPLYQTVIAELLSHPSATTPIIGGAAVRIHTGPIKTVKKLITLHLGGAGSAGSAGASVAPAGLSTGGKVAVGIGVSAAAAGGAWLALGKPLTLQALKSAVDRLVHKL